MVEITFGIFSFVAILLLIFAGSVLLSGTLLYILGKKELFQFKAFVGNEPIKFNPVTNHGAEMKYILESIPKLNLDEAEVLIQQIFKRPVRIIRCRDKDGTSWLEGVYIYFTDREEDVNFLMGLDQEKDKGYGGIG